MIPKLLHYVWIGPYDDNRSLVNDWLNVMPDYKLMVWDNTAATSYLRECVDLFGGIDNLKNTTFAFISDVVRLLVLRDHGGVYLDHDMLVYKDFTELLVDKKLALTFQYDPMNKDSANTWGKGMKLASFTTRTWPDAHYNTDTVNNCFIAAEPNHPVIKKMIDLIVENHFKPEHEQYPMSDWGVGPSIATAACRSIGLDINDSETVEQDGIIVYHRSLLHPVHSVERARMGSAVYYKYIDELVRAKKGYAVHMHDNCGTDLFMQGKLNFFDQWYTENL